ncbi:MULTISPECIES: TrbC/VirB2 family protein [Methylophaga]|uniref:TrbC/VirB2 family protein n=1 Tax=Methylophaga TaxID=40222 RepID=UPI00146CF808|nr:TrbC/VirB2 family protein [Methylophaga nitratireducenticrescens]
MKIDIRRLSAFLFLTFFTTVAFATDIGAPSSGFFANIGQWMQDLVDFFEGPFGLFISIVALAIAAALWAFAPRGDEGLGKVSRVIIAVLVLVNIPGLIVALQAT